MLCRISACLLLAANLLLAADPPGIFADFTTSMGSFTCQLDYTNAPKAVANFVGLATGQRGWISEKTGSISSNRFYNGLTFHRVVTNFMVQGGCPRGNGTGGPGYSFVDEFASSLRFTNSGVLAMANSGPDSNGSQFFITVGATPWLNDLHTIFGRVTSGQSVVDAISKVPTNSASRPLTPVVIQDVQIRRNGAAATAFNIHGQGLPMFTNVPMAISNTATNALLSSPAMLNAENILLSSADLRNWWMRHSGTETLPAKNASWTARQANTNASEFFRMLLVQYPSTRPAPKTVEGKSIAFAFNGGLGTAVVLFGPNGAAFYQWPAQGILDWWPADYAWKQDPFRGRLLPMAFFGLPELDLHLRFDSTTNGVFSGTLSGAFRFINWAANEGRLSSEVVRLDKPVLLQTE
jgi:peptidyl-prolyl cis-trans isomerase A (cyclophilin A)